MKYSMFIGRWQPWHDCHRWLIDQRLNEGKNVLIISHGDPMFLLRWWFTGLPLDKIKEVPWVEKAVPFEFVPNSN